MRKEKLFDQFPPVPTKEWMARINCDLKGADFNKKLVWNTDEGFDVMPFYRMEDIENMKYLNTLPGRFPFLRGSKSENNFWHIRQNIEVSDYITANRKALTILMNGVDSLGFIIEDPESVNLQNFKILFKDIEIENIEINFLCNGKAKEIYEIINDIVRERHLNRNRISGAVETDPLGRLMVNGALCVPVEKGMDYLAELTASAAVLPNFRTIHINASYFNNAGADLVIELAFAVSMGCEYLSLLTDRGVNVENAASKIRFSFGIGSEYFSEIARLRAARLIWSVILDRFLPDKAKEAGMIIHCVTSGWNKTVYDPYVNMLRTQTEAMSAVIGGTNSLTVEPFDKAFRKPDEFSERIAVNQQLLIKEEAYFDKVIDPSAGSYYIENLTSLIADKSWKLFLEVEDNGGFLSCLKSGFIQTKLSQSAEKRRNNVATRKRIFLGTNQYPNNNEEDLSSVNQDIAFRKAEYDKDLFVKPISFFRGSEEYDRIRMAVDRAAKRPVVFLLTIGDKGMRKARAQFATGFFGCAGYKLLEYEGFSTVEKAVSASLEAKPDIVVICSSDEEYPQYAPDIYEKLKGTAIIVVAGNPPCIKELKEKGIELFIHLRSNVPEILGRINSMMGIAM